VDSSSWDVSEKLHAVLRGGPRNSDRVLRYNL
jgi:hypothetical protein